MSASPGPWRWGYHNESGGLPIKDANGGVVADVWNASAADAALIASVPQLAADLAEAVRLLRRVHWETANVTQDLSDGVNAFLARVDAR